jgi:hypothetical protein
MVRIGLPLNELGSKRCSCLKLAEQRELLRWLLQLLRSVLLQAFLLLLPELRIQQLRSFVRQELKSQKQLLDLLGLVPS